MARARFKIQRAPDNTFWLTFDDLEQNEEIPRNNPSTGYSTANQAIDALVTQIVAMPGSPYKLEGHVVSL